MRTVTLGLAAWLIVVRAASAQNPPNNPDSIIPSHLPSGISSTPPQVEIAAPKPPVLSTAELVKKVMPNIFRIEVVTPTVFRDKLGVEHEGYGVGTGTGFVVGMESQPGSSVVILYIVTNAHVVLEKNKWNVKTEFRISGGVFDAKLHAVDVDSDLAVIVAKQERFSNRGDILRWSTHPYEIGEDVVAIGYAMGLNGSPSVTKGIISADNRNMKRGNFSGLIQTTAAINHGNSGGPLLNMRGEVLGVNTYTTSNAILVTTELNLNELISALEKAKDALARSKGQENTYLFTPPGKAITTINQGIFFARSFRTAHPFVNSMIENKAVARGSLGNNVYESCGTYDPDQGYDEGSGWNAGVQILKLEPGSVAEKAGLQIGDVMTGLCYRHKPITAADLLLSGAAIGPELSPPIGWTYRQIHCLGDLANELAVLRSGQLILVDFFRPTAGNPDRGESQSYKVIWWASDLTLRDSKRVVVAVQ